MSVSAPSHAPAPGARVRDGLSLLAVLAVCGAMTYWAWVFVSRYASAIPFYDDLELVLPIAPGGEVTWDTYWHAHNEHRMVVSRFIHLASLGCTRDFRAAMYVHVLLLALLSVVLVLAARALRGRSSPAEAFFPLALLHWGNPQNLLLGTQTTVVVPVLLVTAFVLLELCRSPHGPGRAALMSACLVLLPLNGGFGLMQVPPLACFAAARGWSLLRRPAARERAAGAVLLAGVLALALLIYAYFVGLRFPALTERSLDVPRVLWTSIQFLSLCLGPIGRESPVLVPILALIFPALALGSLAHAWRSRPDQRWQVAVLLAGMAAAAALAVGIGFGRSALMAGLQRRYVIAPMAWYACAYLALARFGPRRLGALAQAAVAVTLAALVPHHVEHGQAYGNVRQRVARKLQADVDAGRSVEDLARDHYRWAYPSLPDYAQRLSLLEQAGLPPFHEVRAQARPQELFRCEPRPLHVVSPRPTLAERFFGKDALALSADSELVLSIPPGAAALTASYGLPPVAWGQNLGGEKRSAALRVLVEWRPPDAPARVLFQRDLDTRSRKEDRELQELRVELPPAAHGELVLAMRALAGPATDRDWGFWADVVLR